MVVLLIALLLLTLILWFYLFPVRFVSGTKRTDTLLEPPELFLYSYVLHIHTQFSYDSLGKPEDVIRARDRLGIDYAIVTDHDNDSIKNFADSRLIAGKEIKLNDENGLVGDLLDIGELKIIAHNFREKYRWRLERPHDYLLELIDLRDALLENKLKLTVFLIAGLVLYPFMGKRVADNFRKLIDIELYARKYFEQGWQHKVVGGLDHHVKLYAREVKTRLLIPDYELSFRLVRNYVLTRRSVTSGEELLRAIKLGQNVISFCGKPCFVWKDKGLIKVSSPFKKSYIVVLSPEGAVDEFVGPNCVLDIPQGGYIILGYNYSFRIWRLLFGIKPAFVSCIPEVKDDGNGETFTRLGKGEDTTKGSK